MMPFVERDSKKEKKRIKELISTSEEARIAHEEFEAQYNLRKALVMARKNEKITQKQLSEITGLTQQSISRIETGSSNTTLENLTKYLRGIGYSIELNKIL